MRKSKRLNTRRKLKYSKRKTKRQYKRNRQKTRRYRARGGNSEEIQNLRDKLRGFLMFRNNGINSKCKLKWKKLNDYPSMLDMLKDFSIKINNYPKTHDELSEIEQTKNEFKEKYGISNFSNVKTRSHPPGGNHLDNNSTVFLNYNDGWNYLSKFISSSGRNFVGRKIFPREPILNMDELEYWLLYFNILYYEIKQNADRSGLKCIPDGMSFRLIKQNVNNYISEPLAVRDPSNLKKVLGLIKSEIDNYTF